MKKKKLEKFLDINTEGEQLDHLMKEIIEEKFDTELKSKYATILNDRLDVQRSAKPKKMKPWRKYRIAAVLITLVGVALVAYFALNQIGSGADRVQNYLAQHQLLYSEATRNSTVVPSQNKSTAYQQFNQGQYRQFLALLSAETITEEDRFFIAYAKMREADYLQAFQEFETFCSNLRPTQKYYEEAHLYKALCLFKTNEREFEDYFNELADDSWIRKELAKLR